MFLGGSRRADRAVTTICMTGCAGLGVAAALAIGRGAPLMALPAVALSLFVFWRYRAIQLAWATAGVRIELNRFPTAGLVGAGRVQHPARPVAQVGPATSSGGNSIRHDLRRGPAGRCSQSLPATAGRRPP